MYRLACIGLVHVISGTEEGEARYYLLLASVEIYDLVFILRLHDDLTMVEAIVAILTLDRIVIVESAVIASTNGGLPRDKRCRQSYLGLMMLLTLDLCGKVVLV